MYSVHAALFLLQILPLLVSMVIFTIYIYFLPTNNFSSTVLFEIMILGHIVVILSLNTTSYIQDSLVQTFESINETSCQNFQVLTKKTLLLLVLYYFPLFIALMYITLQFVKLLKCTKCTKEKYVSL